MPRRELAEGFERKIGHIVEAVTVAAGEMQGMSAVDEPQQRGNGAADRRGGRRIDPSLVNVGTVAAAAEELTASISAIAQQVTRSAEIAGKAAKEARRTNAVVEGPPAAPRRSAKW